MSTIASPRDPGAPFPRRMNSSSQPVGTPTSSARPSVELPRSATGSPNPNAGSLPNKRANRAALREYYNLKKNASGAATPMLEVTSDAIEDSAGITAYSEIPPSELDVADFDAGAYVSKTLASSGLADLLRTYTRVLGEMRALDAEKKALVYDNYSRLISATETIRKMRGAMDPLTPMASTLDPAIARIYEQAAGIRDALRKELKPPVGLGLEVERSGSEGIDGDDERKRRKEHTRQLAVTVLEVPERMQRLIKEGRVEDARKEWELPRRLLESWNAKGIGGDDVYALLEEGDAILREAREEETPERNRNSTE